MNAGSYVILMKIRHDVAAGLPLDIFGTLRVSDWRLQGVIFDIIDHVICLSHSSGSEPPLEN